MCPSGFPAGLLDDKCQRIRLVEQSQFPFWFIHFTRIEIDPAPEQQAMHVGHQTARIPAAVRTTVVVLSLTLS